MPTDNSPIDAVSLQLPQSYGGNELPVAWRSRYGKTDANGNYVLTRFSDFLADPQAKLPTKKISNAPNIWIAKLDKGFSMQMLSQVITANGIDPNIKLLDWNDARAAEIAARVAGIE